MIVIFVWTFSKILSRWRFTKKKKKNLASHDLICYILLVNQFHLTAFVAQVEDEKTTQYKEQFYSFHGSVKFVMIWFFNNFITC